MSYCRNNGKDSDVYVICGMDETTHKSYWECVGCHLTEENYGKVFRTRLKMLAHLDHHRSLGDKVPTRTTTRLLREISEAIDAG